MALDIQRTLDFGNARKIINLPDGTNAQDPVTFAQLSSAIEGLKNKDPARVSTQSNINLATPGATIDGVTLISGNRVLVRSQTAGAENGLYIFNGSAAAMTRSLDASTFTELENALVPIAEGTDTTKNFRQTVTGGTLNTTTITWTAFGTGATAASESTSGILKLATQVLTDGGTDDLTAVTPLKLKTSIYGTRKYDATIGDGTATSYTIAHNLGTRDIQVQISRNSGNYDTVLAEIQRTSTNSITILFDTAPAANAYRVSIRA